MSKKIETKSRPDEPTRIVKLLEKEKKKSLRECWGYHKNAFKDIESSVSLAELETFLSSLQYGDEEDIAWYYGLICGLEKGQEIAEEVAKAREVAEAVKK